MGKGRVATSNGMNELTYDPGEHRTKHCWNNTHAEVVRNGSAAVGKCPSTLSKEQARNLLDDAEYEGKVAGQPISEVQPKRIPLKKQNRSEQFSCC